jgi:hypothetical protein
MKPFRLAGACLAAIIAGWSMLAAGGVAGPGGAGPGAAGSPARASEPGVSVVLTAMQGPQARVLNPGSPTGLTATAGNGRVTLSWTAPASDGGAGISGYLIYQGTSPGGESGVPVNAALVQATSCTLIGLTNGTAYYFKVVAVNDAEDQGQDSAEASATPASASAAASGRASTSQASGTGAPGAPTSLTATAGNAEVSLYWTAPASDGGSPLTRYNVYVGTGSGFSAGAVVTGTSATVTGLTNGATYYFVVTAVGANGKASAASGEVSAEPIGNAVLTSKKVPTPVIVSLAAVAVGAIAGAMALTTRRLRQRPPRSHPPSDVRAWPDQDPHGPVTGVELLSHQFSGSQVPLSDRKHESAGRYRA